MYVRIIDLKHGHSVLHECEQVTFNRFFKSDDQHLISIDIKGATGFQTVEIDKNYNEIYIMNNDGKTIESHRWPDWVTREIKHDVTVAIDTSKIAEHLEKSTELKENL